MSADRVPTKRRRKGEARVFIPCACGCGEQIAKWDSQGRPRRYALGHQTRAKTPLQIHVASRNMQQNRGESWNRGKSYRLASKTGYANLGSWNRAVKRTYGDACMACGWAAAPCDSHHIVARSAGGPNTLENAVVLCPNCHRLAHYGHFSSETLHTLRNQCQPLVGAVGGEGG